MNAFLAIVQNVVRTTGRERGALIFTLLLPVFLMGLFGTIFSGNGGTLPIAVVDHDHSRLSQHLLRVLRAQKGLKVEVGTLTRERDRLRSDDVVLVAVIPSGFQAAIAGGAAQPATITTLLDRNQLQEASLAQSAVAQIVGGFAQAASGRPPAVVVRASRVNTTNVTTLDFYLPSMIAYIILIAGIQAVAIALVDLRERKVLRRFLATPLTPLQILGGQIVGRAVTVVAQVVLLILVGLFVFHAHTHGSWALAWLSILVGAACFVSIGFLVTGLTRTSEAARGVASAITFPMMFLSGIFIPLSQLPVGLQDAVHILPLTYLSDALHQVLNNGQDISAIWVDLLVLSAWAVASLTLAASRFRWD
jgi:ABC-2 type transport system permease protein